MLLKNRLLERVSNC